MYETVRDIIRAEREAGHEAILVDVGIPAGKVRARNVGKVDARPGGISVVAQDYGDAMDADLFVVSDNIPADFLSRTKRPCVQIMHGRPRSSFLMSRKPEGAAYQIYAARAGDPRWAKFVTLWTEFLPFWRSIIPDDKLVATDYPPCDLAAFTSAGERHVWAAPGEINILLSDQFRDDIDPYFEMHVLLELARIWRGPKIKAHFYALHSPLGPWELLFAALRKAGILGETCGQMTDIDRRYRAADVLLSPHTIATRTIREALACGCPVVAARPCRHTPWTIPREDPCAAAMSLRSILELFSVDPGKQRARAAELARPFALDAFAKSIIPIYESVAQGA